jgi:hypothetical protein
MRFMWGGMTDHFARPCRGVTTISEFPPETAATVDLSSRQIRR